MKTKGIVITFACVLTAAFLLGASGAVRVAGDAGEAEENGRLIGAFITTEHLELSDTDAFIENNIGHLTSGGEISPEESAVYQDRLYASLADEQPDGGGTVRTKEYIFEGVDGICYFAAELRDEEGSYTSSGGDEAISDGHMALSHTDDGELVTLEGTIYVSVLSGAKTFYVNPVYQAETGAVYACAGNGMLMSGDLVAGRSHSVTLSESQSTTIDGKTEKKESSVTITVEYIDPPESVSVIQLDSSSTVIARTEYTPELFPETLTAEAATEYIVVETHAAGAETRRELFDKSDETLAALRCREDGVCVKSWAAIEWRS